MPNVFLRAGAIIVSFFSPFNVPPQVSVAQLTKDYDNLVGDALVSAGMIAYSGPFTPDFRQKLVKGWQEKLVEVGIPHSDGCDVRLTLADPVQVCMHRVTICSPHVRRSPSSSTLDQGVCLFVADLEIRVK